MRPGSQPKVCKVPFYYKSIKVTTPQRYIDDNEIHVDIGPRYETVTSHEGRRFANHGVRLLANSSALVGYIRR
jgi:hypothetical protein